MTMLMRFFAGFLHIDPGTFKLLALTTSATCWLIKDRLANPVMALLFSPLIFFFSLLLAFLFTLGATGDDISFIAWLAATLIAGMTGCLVTVGIFVWYTKKSDEKINTAAKQINRTVRYDLA